MSAVKLIPQSLLDEIERERHRQEAKFPGQVLPASPAQLWPHFDEHRTARHLEIPSEARAKFLCDEAHRRGQLTHGEVLSEEHSEAQAAAARKDPVALRTELIQVAASAIRFIGAIDRGEVGF
ncbi:MAG TPA: hypothetical protein VMW52_12350 [Phycisphaerae bacterium]|nr:hypothetical protein [Phycisphaerae bacterium]